MLTEFGLRMLRFDPPPGFAPHRLRALCALVMGIAVLLSAARPATAQTPLRNFGNPPPDCTVPKVIQNDGDFPPPPLGPPGCRLIDSAALTITSAIAVLFDPNQTNGPGSHRLQIEVSTGSVTKNNQSYPITNVYVSSNVSDDCFQWGDGNPAFECVPVYRFRNPDGSGGSGGNVPLCNDGTCKLLFTPEPGTSRQWVRLTLEGHATGLSSIGAHAWASAIVFVDPPSSLAARFTWQQTQGRTVRFDASTSVGTIDRYHWTFADQTPAVDTTTPTIDHDFPASGDYTVGLTVFHGTQSDSTSHLVTVARVLALSMTSVKPEPLGARSGDRVIYHIDAEPSELAASLVVTATVQLNIVDVEPGSITQGGVLTGNTIRWELTNTAGTNPPLEFAVVVRSAGLPDHLLFVPASAAGVARFADQTEVTADADGTVPYLRTLVDLALDAVTRKPGKTGPEEEIRYVLHANIREDVPDEIVVETKIPLGTKLVPGSITGGGVASRDGIRWRFVGVAPPAQFEFKVQVLEKKKLPKNLVEIAAAATATATFQGREETRQAAVTSDLILPGTLRGVVKDIVFNYPKTSKVDVSKGVAGATVRLLDDANVEVDTFTTGSNGKFAVEVPGEGSFTLEARALADFFSYTTDTVDLKSRVVRAVHRVHIDADGHMLVDDKALEGDLRKGFGTLNAYVPITLVKRASELISRVYNYDITYLLLVPFDVHDLFNNIFPRYDVAAPVKALDAAIALEDFIDTDGNLAHFEDLYRGTGAKDPWNATIRLVTFLAQFERRLQEAVKLADSLSKALSIAIVTNLVSKGLPKLNSKLNDKLGREGPPRVDMTTTERGLKVAKISTMAFGVGIGLPYLLDALGISGAEKAEWIEIVAKGVRYAADLFFLKQGYLSGELDRDLTFEAIFFAMRIGTLSAAMKWYEKNSQEPLDDVGRSLELGVYGGDSFEAFRILQQIDARVETRSQNLLATAGAILGDISLIRGLNGVLNVGRPFFTGEGKPGENPILKKIKRDVKDTFEKQRKFLSKFADWATLIQYEVIVGGVIDEFIVRGSDVIALQSAALFAADLGAGTSSMERAFAPLPTAPTTAGGRARPTLPDLPPTPELTAYLAALAQVADAVGHQDLAAWQTASPPFLAAHDTFFDALDALYDRAAVALPVLTPAARTQVETFIDTRHALGQVTSVAYGTVDLWRGAPEDKTISGPAAKLLQLVGGRAGEAATGFSMAAPLLEGLSVPGGVIVRSEGEPDADALLAGQPFALAFRARNPGDTTVAAATAELVCGPGIAVQTASPLAVPALAPGGSVALEWQATAAPPDPGGFNGSCQVRVLRDGAFVSTSEEPIMEYAPAP